MPRTEPETFTCTCHICIKSAGLDTNGLPIGCSIPRKNRVAHLRRAQIESGSQDNGLVSGESRLNSLPSVDELATALSTTTLKDDGPLIDSQPAQLRTPISLSRQPAPLSGPSDHTTMRTTDGPGLEEMHSLVEALPTLEATQSERPESKRTPHLSKCKRAEKTRRAHIALDFLESKVDKCLADLSLLEETPNTVSITTLEQEVAGLQRAFDAVKRSVPSVLDRKAKIKPNIDNIQQCLSKYSGGPATSSVGPLSFDSRKLVYTLYRFIVSSFHLIKGTILKQ